ncbi:hypothetical protein GCM10012275_57640 [Longimycelium tulufanense]|uniref:Uncharacterized protein n=1 Tax=Longimycelium tulufanense TaxID=907463 RepID=A0A8J3CDR1_9PSEU|nr:hypothetical protein [Longimycelium tulufanense]GGM79483.1 hypothetical protein GCM10012275_57640 [Longimycelium tulufanense]
MSARPELPYRGWADVERARRQTHARLDRAQQRLEEIAETLRQGPPEGGPEGISAAISVLHDQMVTRLIIAVSQVDRARHLLDQVADEEQERLRRARTWTEPGSDAGSTW